MRANKQKYTYILVGNIFVNLEQNIISLFILLFFKAKSFEEFNRLSRRRIPVFLLRFVRILQFTHKFYNTKKQYDKESRLPIISSNYYGNCLIELRQGEYKVFDFKKKLVTTTFPYYFSETSMKKKINNLKKAETCILAPRLIKWNVKERFLVEEYKNKKVYSYELIHLNRYIIRITPIIGEIISTTEPKYVNFYKYYFDEIKLIYLLIDSKNKLYNKYEIDNLNNIKRFIDYSMKMFKNNFDIQNKITLVLSHGDLWEGNILIERNEISVIDWDTIGNRSFYFDIYFSIFMLIANKTHFDKVNYEGLAHLNDELEESILLFYNNLHKVFKDKNSYYKSIPKQFEVYRHMFYIELITLILKENEKDPRKNLTEINTWIKRFQYFEELRAYE